MARISGNVNSDGSKSSDTSNSDGFSSQWVGGDYKITFDKAFTELPSVLAHEINYDFRANNAPLVVRVTPSLASVTIGFFNQNTNAPVQVQFAFVSFGAN